MASRQRNGLDNTLFGARSPRDISVSQEFSRCIRTIGVRKIVVAPSWHSSVYIGKKLQPTGQYVFTWSHLLWYPHVKLSVMNLPAKAMHITRYSINLSNPSNPTSLWAAGSGSRGPTASPRLIFSSRSLFFSCQAACKASCFARYFLYLSGSSIR